MAMEDILPAIVVIAVIYIAFKWLFGSKPSGPGGDPDSIRGVDAAMVASVHSAFPHIPVPNIIYHLSRTRSSQATSEEIIERGSLPAPPSTFRIPPSLLPPTVNPPSAPSSPIASTSKANPSIQQSLIDRYSLSTRIPSSKGKERESSEGALSLDGQGGVGVRTVSGSGGKWEDTKEKRERELRERKERMILEARRRLLEKESAVNQTSL